jgi:C-terminal processing protease CtpA/Prc
MDANVVDISAQTEIIQNLSEKLKTYYVFPDIAEEICACLQKHLGDGEYADIEEGEFFALALTMHMQEVNQDKHLWVRWHPDSLPDHEGRLSQSQAWQNEHRQQAELDNYGLYKVERLPGNVGYLDIREFYNSSWAGDTAAAAMNFLANTNVLIVDLSKCKGGDPDTVALIVSYLFGEERVRLSSLYWREDNATLEYWTLPYVPGKRFGGDKPIYILTSKDTFSGGEAFAYDLKAHQRAILIGESTGGGAHPGSTYRLAPHFEVFIPNGRAINPITETNWEGSGVVPDISVLQEQAFKVAYSIALKSIVESLNGATEKPFTLLKEEAQKALMDLEKESL